MANALRVELQAALEAAFTAAGLKWRMVASRRVPTRLDGTTVVLRQQTVAKGPTKGLWDTTFELVLLSSIRDPDKVDDALEDDLEALLETLDALPQQGLRWTEAERGTFATGPDTEWHGYSVPLTYTNRKA